MRSDLQRFWQRVRDVLSTWGLAIAIIGATFYIAYQFVEPAPPKSIVFVTGAAGGAYQRFGEQYASFLAREGIIVELRATAGSVQNLTLLNEKSGADVGFVQGGLNESAPTENVTALGSLYLEPLWLFVASDTEIDEPRDFLGKRIAVGAQGSGTRAVVQKLFSDHGINSSNASLVELATGEVADAFANEKIDAAFLVAAPESDQVAALLDLDGIRIEGLRRTDAYARRYAYLSKVTLPQGVLNLQLNIPETDIDTVALTAMLAVNSELHPALAALLLVAATEIHGQHTLLANAGEFPTPLYTDLPVSEEAERFFTYGPPFLLRYLPFWAATLIDRLWIMLLPLIGLAIPLVKLVPPAYRWRIRRRILSLYSQLESIDPSVNAVADNEDLSARLQMLESLEKNSLIDKVPREYTDDIYKLRRDIDLVRRKLRPEFSQLS